MTSEDIKHQLIIIIINNNNNNYSLLPTGTETTLMQTREWDKSTAGFQQWPLMSVHTWGEDPKGVWRLRVRDDVSIT